MTLPKEMELEDELAFRLKEDVLMAPCALTLACKVLVLLEPPPMLGEALLEFRVVTRDVLHTGFARAVAH